MFSKNKFGILLILIFPVLSNSADKWTWVNPLPQGNNLNGLVFTDSSSGCAIGDLGTVIKTNDGAKNWTVSSIANVKLNALVFPSKDTGFIVGDDGVIFKTNDAGNHWSEQNSSIIKSLTSVYFLDNKNGFAVGIEGTFLKTTNGGINWTPQKFGDLSDLREVCFPTRDTGYLVDSLQFLLKTLDGGMNWVKVFNDSIGIRKVFFPNPDTGFISSYNSIYKTMDGGLNWKEIIHNPTHWPNPFFENSNIIHVTFGVDSNLYSVDGGNHWIGLPSNSISSKVSNFYFLNGKNGFGIGQSGIIVKTVDWGKSWEEINKNANNSLEVSYNGMYFPTRQTGYFSTLRGIFKSEDAGVTWKNISQFDQSKYILPDGIYFENDLNGFVAGNGGDLTTNAKDGFLKKTIDGGKTWSDQLMLPGVPINFILFPDPQNGYIMGGNKIFKSQNRGQSWIQMPDSPLGKINCVSFPTASLGYISDYNSIYKTVNGGNKWNLLYENAKFDTIGSKEILSIYFANEKIGFFSGDRGEIYKTNDGGNNWKVVYKNLNQNRIIKFKFINSNIGFGVGPRGQIIKTENGGEDWLQVNNITDAPFFDITFLDSTTGFISGRSNGWYSSPIILKFELEPIPNSMIAKKTESAFKLDPNGQFIYYLGKKTAVNVVINDCRGRIAATILNGIQDAGAHQISLPFNSLPHGIYYMAFEAEGIRKVYKAKLE